MESVANETLMKMRSFQLKFLRVGIVDESQVVSSAVISKHIKLIIVQLIVTGNKFTINNCN